MFKKKIISFTIFLVFIFALFPLTQTVGATGSEGSDFVAIATSGHTLALKEDGSLWAWGSNSVGQLGDGTTTDRLSPIKVMEDVVSFALSSGYNMAIKKDGSLWAWGRNFYGVLGDGTVTVYDYAKRVTVEDNDRHIPFKVMDSVSYVSVSTYHTMAIRTDGSLWAWGHNSSGQLGDGTITKEDWSSGLFGGTIDNNDRYKPIKVMDDVRFVATGDRHTIAIKTDGSFWSWGSNLSGQLADSSNTEQLTDILIPTKVEMDNVVKVFAEGDRTALLKSDGSLWMCGDNVLGGLGNGEPYKGELYNAPFKLMDDVTYVAMGLSSSMALKSDGSLWGWGWNDFGQLGDGTTESRLTPFKVMDGVSAVAAYGHTIVIKEDHSLWAFGSNSAGQFGNGTTTGSLTPTKIIAAAPRTANPTASTVSVNNAVKAFEAYNIGGSNFFKLRDLAYALNGTAKQFEVGYDNATKAVTLTSGSSYTPVGGEMAQGDSKAKNASPTASKIYLDGMELNLTIYNIGGNNFFKLRDLMAVLDVYVGYDNATKAITLDTSKGYVAE
jgi:alpha-tubulin suppressor-like RCC1 family protein